MAVRCSARCAFGAVWARQLEQEDVCKPKPGSGVEEAGDARSTGDESEEYRHYEDDASNRGQRVQRVQARASGGSCDGKKRLKAWWRTGRSCSDDETTGCVQRKTMAGTTRPYEERCRSSRVRKGICWNSEMRCDVMRCDACNRMGPGCVRDAGRWPVAFGRRRERVRVKEAGLVVRGLGSPGWAHLVVRVSQSQTQRPGR